MEGDLITRECLEKCGPVLFWGWYATPILAEFKRTGRMVFTDAGMPLLDPCTAAVEADVAPIVGRIDNNGTVLFLVQTGSSKYKHVGGAEAEESGDYDEDVTRVFRVELFEVEEGVYECEEDDLCGDPPQGE
jgi:hypothetical protein